MTTFAFFLVCLALMAIGSLATILTMAVKGVFIDAQRYRCLRSTMSPEMARKAGLL